MIYLILYLSEKARLSSIWRAVDILYLYFSFACWWDGGRDGGAEVGMMMMMMMMTIVIFTGSSLYLGTGGPGKGRESLRLVRYVQKYVLLPKTTSWILYVLGSGVSFAE